MSSYIYDLGSGDERRRLDALASLYDSGSTTHLVQLGVGPGWHCLEVGAGSGTIARWLAARIGGSGRLVVTDTDTRFVKDLSSDNVEVRVHDVVNDVLEERAFDLVHARSLLEHLPERERALHKMVQALRPGGWLMAEDVVFPPAVSHPDMPLLAKVLDAFESVFRSAGVDPKYGTSLPKALADAGLTELGSQAYIPLVHSGTSSADLNILSVEQLAPTLITTNLVTQTEVDEILTWLREPGWTTFAPIMVTAWGRNAAVRTHVRP